MHSTWFTCCWCLGNSGCYSTAGLQAPCVTSRKFVARLQFHHFGFRMISFWELRSFGVRASAFHWGKISVSGSSPRAHATWILSDFWKVLMVSSPIQPSLRYWTVTSKNMQNKLVAFSLLYAVCTWNGHWMFSSCKLLYYHNQLKFPPNSLISLIANSFKCLRNFDFSMLFGQGAICDWHDSDARDSTTMLVEEVDNFENSFRSQSNWSNCSMRSGAAMSRQSCACRVQS